MAVWQYIAYLIPTASLSEDGSLAGLTVTSESFDHPPLQYDIAPVALEKIISAYLPPRESWSPDIHAWGDERRDDIDINYGGERIDIIRARLDLRDVTIERIANLVRLAREIDCCFLEGRTFAVISADEDALVESIRASRPARFVRDPHGFLKNLSRDPSDQ